MGFFFSLQDANIAAYLTDRRAKTPPRMTTLALLDFLGGIRWPDVAQADPLRPTRGFVSSDPRSVEAILDATEKAHRVVRENPLARGADGFVDSAVARGALSELQDLLSGYSLFALTIRSRHEEPELQAEALAAAYSSHGSSLILITDCGSAQDPLEYLDPFPALAPLAEVLGDRPGMLLWTRLGTSAYVPLRDFRHVYAQLTLAFDGGDEALSEVLLKYRKANRAKRLLHLSDLHLGTLAAAENQELLLTRLETVVRDVDRVVITGDLYDEPLRSYAIHYKNFDGALRRLCDKPPIIVPGNHDQKRFGNVRQDLRQAIDLEWEAISVDDDMQAVFHCFDSSVDANLARGKVTMTQKRDVAVAFEACANKRPDIRSYLRVALIHHHPFSFQADQESLLNRGLKLVGKTDEYFLQMEDGEAFVDWCARREIPLILHGHKHVARHVRKCVAVGNSNFPVTAVGCGTSLGAEGKPVSYNVVCWDPGEGLWSATYYADPGDGGGFVGEKLIVSPHTGIADAS